MYASIGEVAVNRVPVATNQAIIAILPKSGIADVDYLYFSLKHFGRGLVSYNVQTTQKNVSKAIVERFPIPLPPLAEQRAIARILRTVQRAREQTEAVISATRQLKASLLRHLFTYGPVALDKADQVPPKETEIGQVPEHWEVVPLARVAALVQYGTSERCETRLDGSPVLRIPNVIGGKIDLTDLKFAAFHATEAERLRLTVGDLLFVRTNDEAQVGQLLIEGSPNLQPGPSPSARVLSSRGHRPRIGASQGPEPRSALPLAGPSAPRSVGRCGQMSCQLRGVKAGSQAQRGCG
jgi:hypothetical protein